MNKKLLFGASFAFTTIIACNTGTGKDSEKIAEKQNKEKADTTKAAGISEDDSKFLVKATSGVTMEVELGKYAELNAASASVKSFGKMMSEDHGKDKAVLTKMATDKNINIPTEPGEDFKKNMSEIMGKKGADFDKAYIKFMVSDHKDDISEFEKEVKDGTDDQIKAFATKGVPVLQHHLDMAKAIDDQLK